MRETQDCVFVWGKLTDGLKRSSFKIRREAKKRVEKGKENFYLFCAAVSYSFLYIAVYILYSKVSKFDFTD